MGHLALPVSDEDTQEHLPYFKSHYSNGLEARTFTVHFSFFHLAKEAKPTAIDGPAA
jgi:hypothetical protein